MTEPNDDLARRLRAVEFSRPGIALADALERHARRRAELRPLRWMVAAAAAVWLVVFLGGSMTAHSLQQLSGPAIALAREEPDPDYLRGMFARRLEILSAAEAGAAHDETPASGPEKTAPVPEKRRGELTPTPVCEGDGSYV